MRSRPELLQQLRELSVETVTAEYNGQGDDGQIDSLEFGSVAVPDGVTEAVEGLFYEVLEGLYSGWEDNEGSCGQFVWNVGEDKIHLVHSTRFDSYETEERDL
jgi:hypothetical protein